MVLKKGPLNGCVNVTGLQALGAADVEVDEAEPGAPVLERLVQAECPVLAARAQVLVHVVPAVQLDRLAAEARARLVEAGRRVGHAEPVRVLAGRARQRVARRVALDAYHRLVQRHDVEHATDAQDRLFRRRTLLAACTHERRQN